MGIRIIAGMVALAFAAPAFGKPPQRCRAEPLDLGRSGNRIELVHVISGPDGRSHAMPTTIEARITQYLGLELAQFDLGAPSKVVIVRGPAKLEIPVHAAPFREIFIVLSGSSVITLSDGTEHTLTAGKGVLFEDTTGAGHGGRIGPCGYVALDLQYKPLPPAGTESQPRSQP